MEKYEKYIINFFYLICIIMGYLLIFSTLHYFDVLSYSVIKVLSFIMIIILMGYLSYKYSRKSKYKGLVNGVIIGAINICFFLMLSLICGLSINFLYYIILLIPSLIGGIIGKNAKEK